VQPNRDSEPADAAREVLAQSESLVLTDRERDQFLELLESSPKPNRALKQLLRGK